MQLGGGKHKINMGRRFLQSLQQGVEGLGGEHVYFINDNDLVFAGNRQVADILLKFTDFLNPAIAGPIDFMETVSLTLIERLTGSTLITGPRPTFHRQTVEGFSDQAGQGGLAYPPDSGKE